MYNTKRLGERLEALTVSKLKDTVSQSFVLEGHLANHMAATQLNFNVKVLRGPEETHKLSFCQYNNCNLHKNCSSHEY